MRSITLFTAISLAFVAGENTGFAQSNQLVTMCFRGRTIQVPSYLVSRYRANGATLGPCPAPTTSWLNASAGNWLIADNWSAGVPGAATNAQITNGGTAQIVSPSAFARNVSLGNMFEGSGTLEVLAAQASFNDIVVGLAGDGTLSIRNGGQASIAASGIIGDGPASSGVATVDGTNSKWTSAGEVDVANNGTGTLSITGGGAVSNTNGYIAHLADSNGTATVAGAASTWTNSGDLYVGHTGNGTLSITAGGKVSNFNSNIGAVSGSNSRATVDGAGSVWTNHSVLAVGSSGSGGLTITRGGVVSSTNGRIAREAGASGVVLIDGPGSRWNCSGAFTMGLAGPDFSLLVVRDGGVLSVAGGMTIGTQGFVLGNGTIVANVINSGVIAPGESPGSLHVTGNYTQTGSGRLQVELASAASFDKLAVTGNLSLPGGSTAGGGKLEISLLDGFLPSPGNTFEVLTYGSRTGTFADLARDYLGEGLFFDPIFDAASLTLVTGRAGLGDTDLDGDIDLADLGNLATSLGVSNPDIDWINGDFDHDDDVDLNDLGTLATFFEGGRPQAYADFQTLVPEPTCTLILALLPGILRRQRPATLTAPRL